MNPHALDLAFALTASQAAWACLLLASWLWRHRRVTACAYRGPHRRRAVDVPAGRRRHHRAKPDWMLSEVIYLASHLGSCRKVEAAFNRVYGFWGDTVGHTWVARVMREHAREIAAMRRERKRRKPAFIPAGHTWALDLTLVRSPFGLTFTVLAILDAGSRKVLRLKVLPRKCAFAIMGHVLLACSEHGPPEVIRSDNEAMFTSRPWLAMLAALGVRARRGPPLQPWHNGRIERFWGTLKQAVGGMRFEAAAALQATLDKFADFYNALRPHQALAGLTPQEAWQGRTMAEVQQAHALGALQRPGA